MIRLLIGPRGTRIVSDAIVQRLVCGGVDANKAAAMTTLDLACALPEMSDVAHMIIDILKQSDASLQTVSGISPLSLAATRGDLAIVKALNDLKQKHWNEGHGFVRTSESRDSFDYLTNTWAGRTAIKTVLEPQMFRVVTSTHPRFRLFKTPSQEQGSSTPFVCACLANNVDVAQYLWSSTTCSGRIGDIQTILVVALANCSVRLTRFLMSVLDSLDCRFNNFHPTAFSLPNDTTAGSRLTVGTLNNMRDLKATKRNLLFDAWVLDAHSQECGGGQLNKTIVKLALASVSLTTFISSVHANEPLSQYAVREYMYSDDGEIDTLQVNTVCAPIIERVTHDHCCRLEFCRLYALWPTPFSYELSKTKCDGDGRGHGDDDISIHCSRRVKSSFHPLFSENIAEIIADYIDAKSIPDCLSSIACHCYGRYLTRLDINGDAHHVFGRSDQR